MTCVVVNADDRRVVTYTLSRAAADAEAAALQLHYGFAFEVLEVESGGSES